jgi:hypothetical protein
MRSPLARRRPQGQNVIIADWSQEMPSHKGYSSGIVREKQPGGWSHMGNAVLFTEGAAQFAPYMRIDVDGLVGLLSAQNVDDEHMPNLAVVVHAPRERPDNRRDVRARGWHRPKTSVGVESVVDRESVHFAHALHVVAGMDEQTTNHVLLHEAGHLRASALGIEGTYLYSKEGIRSYRRRALASAAGFLAAGAASGYAAAEGLPPVYSVTGAVLGGLGAAAAGYLYKQAPLILWGRSTDEHIAEDFANTHNAQQFVAVHASPQPLPGNHLVVPNAQLTNWRAFEARDFGLSVHKPGAMAA